jgi:hypothetical protein
MPKKPVPETPDALLAAIAARPQKRVAIFAYALLGPGQDAIVTALGRDPPLRAELCAAMEDEEGLAYFPWLVQYAGRCNLREAIPALLKRALAGSDQAARVLIGLGDRDSLEELVVEIRPEQRNVRERIEAVFALGDDYAFRHLSKQVEADEGPASTVLWHLVQEPAIVQRDPRWIDVALAALRTSNHAEAARELLHKVLTPEMRRARFAGATPAVVPSPALPADCNRARASVESLFAKLPSFPLPGMATKQNLDALEEILGRVPPLVRAIYERVDGLTVKAEKPRDSVVLHPTAHVLRQAREWDRRYDPSHTPLELVNPFVWPVAPDGYTKAGMSGGPHYGFELPGKDDDPVMTNTPKKPTFSHFVLGELRKAARRNANQRGGS